MAHSKQEKNARDVPAVAARIAVALVFALNVQCALQFVLWPEAFAGAYELSGVAGEAAVRGLGVAFLMWNATYPPVIASPRRFRALYVVVLVQQAIGLVGETAILLGLPGGHEVLAASILRFIAFDAASWPPHSPGCENEKKGQSLFLILEKNSLPVNCLPFLRFGK